MKQLIAITIVSILFSCAGKKENVASSSSNADEWIVLFDGTSTEGWKIYNRDTLSVGWIIEDGTLKGPGHGDELGGEDIIYAAEKFENFELVLEWKISEGGNSGLLYHVVEGDQYQAFYENGPEYQLIDDLGYPDPLEKWQTVGADYAMYDPADDKIVKPAGEWNESRILFTPEKVEYWLNGKMTTSFVPWSEDWEARKLAGKWKDYPDYGKYKTGYIGLQDHGGLTWFRNIKVKKL
ncbi:MAG: DUF1080 domain-containing protein [Cyclobacteriaceae bacterium]